MKKIIGCLAVLFFMAPVAFAAAVEDWSNVNSGKDTGTFMDTMGSKIDFVTGPGPGGSKAIKITSTMIQGGYCGIWHNISADLSKNDSFKFKVKANASGDIEMSIKDTYSVQYIARFSVTAGDWTEVTVPFSSFNKDPYYTPPEAVLGHPMDMAKTTGLNFSPKIIGDSVVEIGPVEGTGGASGSAAPAAQAAAPAAAAPAAAAPALPSEVSLPSVPDVMELPPALTGAQPAVAAAPAPAAQAAPAVAAPAAPAPAAAPAASASSASTGAVVENWGSVSAGKDTGTFMDTMGSKIDFVVGPGPDGSKALKITSTMIQGGYCGIWHNFSADLSKSNSVKFKAKTTAPGDVEMAFKDTYNVQYIARFAVSSKDWTEVTVPFSSFNKDPYYTPPEAVLGHPMDLSKATGMNFAPKIIGDSVVEIGPVSGAGTASASAAPAVQAAAPAAAAPAAKPAVSSGTAVPILIYDQLDTKAAGGFQDSQGSAFKFEVLDNKGKKYMKITYTLVKGGWSGMWCRAGGIDWNGADLSGTKDIVIKVFTAKPIVIGLALKDKNKNQYIADTPLTKASNLWQTVTVPLSSFVIDPYYTPPDAIKGAPKDFSSVGTFNIQPKSEGTYSFGVDTVVAK